MTKKKEECEKKNWVPPKAEELDINKTQTGAGGLVSDGTNTLYATVFS